MTYKLSKRSIDRMSGIHPDLIAVMELAIQRTPIDFTVLEGLRNIERQQELVRRGASKTMNSRHLTGHAVDIAPLDNGAISWDWPLYHKISPGIKGAAADLGVDLEWGGDWNSFKDGPHWQLSWDTYGKDDMHPRASLETAMRSDLRSVPDAPVMNTPPMASKGRNSPLQSTTIWAQIKQFGATSLSFAYGGWSALQEQDEITRYIILGGLAVLAIYIMHCGRHIITERLNKWYSGVK